MLCGAAAKSGSNIEKAAERHLPPPSVARLRCGPLARNVLMMGETQKPITQPHTKQNSISASIFVFMTLRIRNLNLITGGHKFELNDFLICRISSIYKTEEKLACFFSPCFFTDFLVETGCSCTIFLNPSKFLTPIQLWSACQLVGRQGKSSYLPVRALL